jgi:hypothetical protein
MVTAYYLAVGQCCRIPASADMRLEFAEIPGLFKEVCSASLASEQEVVDPGTTAEEVPVEEAPVEEAPVEEAPVEEAPVEETPVEEPPVEEAPVEEPPVEEAPVVEAPVV